MISLSYSHLTHHSYSLGPYQKYIEALSGSNPGLKRSDPNNKTGPLKKGNALVALLDVPATGQPDFSKAPTEFMNSEQLRTHFENQSHNHARTGLCLCHWWPLLHGSYFLSAPGKDLRVEQ
jgi:hypothetical protein